ncbi:MAG: alpha/beta fold hydrolase [Elusimicrobia bacterium]|jgi:pimeloyl-ACP methyl ester carboxylesterase|nr:alpha/beta fold hydrolase [Elusimicrobiota bacterium]
MKRLLMVLLMAGGWAGIAAEPFDVAVEGPTSNDPIILQGTYTAPTAKGAPVLVTVHGLGSSREEWAPILQRTTDRGWGSLAFDLRGHGRSRGTISGKPVNFEDPDNGRNPAFWAHLPGDLERVVNALKKKNGITPQQIVLIGASVGANTVLDASARLPGTRALVLLSPGLNYAGILTEGPISSLTLPTLLIAAKPDLYAFTSAERLKMLAPPSLLTWKPLSAGTPQGAHGVQLFDGKLEIQILDWIEKGDKR